MKAELDIIDINRGREQRRERGSRESRSRYGERNQGIESVYTGVGEKGTGARQRRSSERRRRRERMIRRIYCGAGVFLCIAIGITTFGVERTIRAKNMIPREREYEKIMQTFQPNQPKVIQDSEILENLLELTKKYPEFQTIYEQSDLYSEELLTALCNNPEMYEFVKGYPQADGSVAGGIEEKELEKKYPLFLQWDKRWGYVSYGDTMIGLSGCGPTCLSMVIVALTRDASVTPDVVASYSMNNGYYVSGTGTAWSLMTEGVRNWGLCAREISLDESVMKYQLDRGCPIICSVKPGDFTAAGHFIVIYGYDEEGFLVNDPNCIARSNTHWTFEDLSWQISIMWSYYIS